MRVNLTGFSTILSMIPQDVLEKLRCPVCLLPLQYQVQPESLRCGQCCRVYPVRDELPILLVEEATVEPE